MGTIAKWLVGAVFGLFLYMGIVHFVFEGCDPKVPLSCREQAGHVDSEYIGRKPVRIGRQPAPTDY